MIAIRRRYVAIFARYLSCGEIGEIAHSPKLQVVTRHEAQSRIMKQVSGYSSRIQAVQPDRRLGGIRPIGRMNWKLERDRSVVAKIEIADRNSAHPLICSRDIERRRGIGCQLIPGNRCSCITKNRGLTLIFVPYATCELPEISENVIGD